MSAPLSKKDIENIILEAVNHRFREVNGFVSVSVGFNDFEGEDVATVRIILDPKLVPLSSEDLRNVGTFLRRVLNSKGAETFPLVRFMSKADHGRVKPETA